MLQVQKGYWTTLHLKQQWENLVVKSNSLLSGFISYYVIPVEWIQGFIQGVGVPVLIVTDSVGDRHCPAQGGRYLEGLKHSSSRKLD